MFTCQFTRGSVVLVAVLQASVVWGQRDGHEFRPVSPLPPELGFSYDHASTALEGALRGRAQLTYSAGAYWLALSQAMTCQEEARQLAIANRERFVNSQRANRAALENDWARGV